MDIKAFEKNEDGTPKHRTLASLAWVPGCSIPDDSGVCAVQRALDLGRVETARPTRLNVDDVESMVSLDKCRSEE